MSVEIEIRSKPRKSSPYIPGDYEVFLATIDGEAIAMQRAPSYAEIPGFTKRRVEGFAISLHSNFWMKVSESKSLEYDFRPITKIIVEE